MTQDQPPIPDETSGGTVDPSLVPRLSPLLLIVTGMPCSGKTTLAHQLAGKLSLPLVTKDDIKERMFDTLGWSDREWSRRLGVATIKILFYVIESMLAGGASLVAESNFDPDAAGKELDAILARCPFRLGIVECITHAEVLRRRWRQRAENSIRHPGHNDLPAMDEFLRLVAAHTGADGYGRLGVPILSVPGFKPPVWEVDTTQPVDLDSLAIQIRQHFLL